jgi:alpha-galactosidase
MGILPADAAAVPPDVLRRLDFAVGGVNHCTAIVRFRYDGKDLMPLVRRKLGEWARKEAANPGAHSKGRYNYAYLRELFDVYGVYFDAIGHTKEYVPFFQGYGKAANRPEPITTFDAEERARYMAEAWAATRTFATGRRPIRTFMRDTHNDHATDIIESMWGQLGKAFYINSANRGAVTNMPADAFLELRSDIDMRGPRPQLFGEFPRGMLALQHEVLDTHELTAAAAVTGDRALLKRAMLTDPLGNNIVDAERCVRDLLAAEREALPTYWYRR